jgi:hypothetical protein
MLDHHLTALLKLARKANPYQFAVQSGTASFARSLSRNINKAACLLHSQPSLGQERI